MRMPATIITPKRAVAFARWTAKYTAFRLELTTMLPSPIWMRSRTPRYEECPVGPCRPGLHPRDGRNRRQQDYSDEDAEGPVDVLDEGAVACRVVRVRDVERAVAVRPVGADGVVARSAAIAAVVARGQIASPHYQHEGRDDGRVDEVPSGAQGPRARSVT